MITELNFTNFKSWKLVEKMRFAPITGLFGTNSSGKTSIMQLLLMLKQTIESTDRAQVIEFGDEKSLTNLGSFREVVHNHEKPGNISFGIQWDLLKQLNITSPDDKMHTLFSTNSLSFDCNLEESISDRLEVTKLSYSLEGHKFSLTRKSQGSKKYELESTDSEFRFIRSTGRVWELPPPVKFYGFPDQVYAYYQNAGFLSSLQLEFENLFSKIYYLGPLREFPQRIYSWKGSEPADMGRRGERVVDALLAARVRGAYISPGYRKKRLTLEECVAIWLIKLGLISSFSVEPIAEGSSIYQVRVQKTPTSAKVLITDVGFGVSQILPVLVLCYYAPEGSILFLEQPEIHLHPSVQSGLADVFIDAIKNRNIQIVVESHSEHLLRRLQRRIAEELIETNKISLYFCESDLNGSNLIPLKVNLFGDILNWPKSFFGDDFTEFAEMTKAAMKRKMRDQL